MRTNCLFVAASKQHVGKTSTSLGIVAGLMRMYGENPRIGFIKPVGQKSVRVQANPSNFVCVDKDVPLFKEVLGCVGGYEEMSPVLIGKGYTRRFLDGEISTAQEFVKIKRCLDSIMAKSDFTVVEGTGHVAVGSSVGLSNATVAAQLGVPMILVLNGGIGSTLDEFYLNMEFCKSEGAKIAGVILNKVKPEKYDDVLHYTAVALEKLHRIPVLGCVPDIEFLANPSVLDFERLGMDLVTHGLIRSNHDFSKIHSMLSGPEQVDSLITENNANGEKPLYVVHGSRVDLLDAFEQYLNQPVSCPFGLLIVGQHVSMPQRASWVTASVPVMATSDSLDQVTAKLRHYTAKLSVSDTQRTSAVIEHYAAHIDFSALLCAAAGKPVGQIAPAKGQLLV